nr:hypothetical protein [Candidatus Sigynarchaeota archaeon]
MSDETIQLIGVESNTFVPTKPQLRSIINILEEMTIISKDERIRLARVIDSLQSGESGDIIFPKEDFELSDGSVELHEEKIEIKYNISGNFSGFNYPYPQSDEELKRPRYNRMHIFSLGGGFDMNGMFGFVLASYTYEIVIDLYEYEVIENLRNDPTLKALCSRMSEVLGVEVKVDWTQQ